MTLEDWDRPELQCRDESCRAYQAGMPHTTDAVHREVLATLRELRTPARRAAIYGNQEFGYRDPYRRKPFLSPAFERELVKRKSRHRRIMILSVAGMILLAVVCEFLAIWLMLQ